MTTRPRIAVFAYSEVGYACLDELILNEANVAIVFTHKDDPDEEIWFHSVKERAQQGVIPVRTDAKIGPEAIEYLRTLDIKLLLSFYYRAMIPDEALHIPRLGAYNLHGALLPKYRGRACINWAVINGETETGATLHVMTKYADRGDIVDSERVPISFEDTALDVFLNIAAASRRIVTRTLPALEAGTAKRTPQDENRATKFGRRRPEDGAIDWSKSALMIYNQIRALTHPFPGAFTTLDGRKTWIWKARPLPGEGKPGEIISENPLRIGTGDGLLEVLSLQPEGEPERSTYR